MTTESTAPVRGFFAVAEMAPDRVALVDPDEKRLTFGQLAERANRLSNAMGDLGLQRGDVATALLPNGQEYFELCLAAAQIGLYLTPINWHLTGSEAGYILADSGSKLLVAHERFADVAVAAAVAAGLPAEACLSVGRIAGFSDYEAAVASAGPERPTQRSSGNTMIYTSGTTGRPKGVKRPLPDLDPDEVGELAAGLCERFELPVEDGVHLVTGPLYHGAPLGFALSSLHAGRTVVVMDKFYPDRALDLIARNRVTDAHFVPTMMHRIMGLDPAERASYDLTSLVSVLHAAAPCPVSLKHAFMGWLGPIVWEYYGSTEGVATMVRPEEWLRFPGTVGRAIEGTELKICDDGRNSVQAGETGKVWIRSALTDFEYHHDPEKTAANRADGFISVGDIGYLNEEGYLFLCDRDADVIISGGVNIYSAEIEAVLADHPDVADVAVIGVPNAEWGEEVKAIVVAADSAVDPQVLNDSILAFCAERLARYKLPRSVELRESLPRQVESGKLYKRLLKAEFWPAEG